MMISTKGRYALTTLIDIAQNFDGVTPVSIKEISDRQKISMKYLEQIISLMVKGGFLKSIRGAKGGYLFTRPIDQIKVGEILDAAEGTLAPVDCVNGTSTCAKSASCPSKRKKPRRASSKSSNQVKTEWLTSQNAWKQRTTLLSRMKTLIEAYNYVLIRKECSCLIKVRRFYP